MGELDPGNRAGRLDGGDDRDKRRSLRVVPNSTIPRGNAALRRHSRSLDRHEACASASKRGVVGNMPVSQYAFDGDVLAHGRDGDPIAKSDVFELERLEKG